MKDIQTVMTLKFNSRTRLNGKCTNYLDIIDYSYSVNIPGCII
jgi:hypothetical protein